MSSPTGTETADTRYAGLDTWDDRTILSALFEGQRRALAAVEAAIPDLARAAQAAASRLKAGGRLIYVAAGSPALMSLADALELPQTYGIARDRVLLVLADGEGIGQRLNGAREDDVEGARADMAAIGVGPDDCVIATSASGGTPYTVAGLTAAREARAATVGIAGNAQSKLLQAAEIPVLIATGPEVIAGSTRMGAGTAQKAALNMLSTLMGVHLGHVHDGLMVNLVADNDKLRARAALMVCRIAEVDADEAARALDAAGGAVKPAVLIAAGADGIAEAERLLAASGGNLRGALGMLRG